MSTCLYGASTALMVSTVDMGAVLGLVRFNTFTAAIHAAAWLHYSRGESGEESTRTDFALSAAALVGGLLCTIPDAVYTTPVVRLTVAWAGVSYPVPARGPWSVAAYPLLLAPMIVVTRRYLTRARQGRAGATAHAGCLLLFLAAALNDLFVLLGLYPGLFLSDAAFLVVIATVAATLVARLTAHAEGLSKTSDRLKTRVVEQSHELQSAKDALLRAERLAELGHLAASVGHEINNPLACVVANIDFVQQELGGHASADLRDALDDTVHASRRIAAIVDELRAHGRSDDGGMNTCAVHEAIEDAARIVKPSLEGVATVSVSLEAAPRVELPVRKLSQVLVNLTMNAAQAMPAARVQDGSGCIIIAAGRDEDGNALVRVRDNGAGMDERTRSRVFEPFFTTKTAGHGIGLGLHVSLSIVRDAGGTITVESEVGTGTIITVVLPAARHQGTAPASASSAPDGAGDEAASVLVIDDEAAVGRSITRLLRGHRIDCVLSVDAARATLRERSYDVVLCDLMMPGGGGAALYHAVASESPALAERFVFITGGATTPEAASFLAARGRRLLNKPFDPRALRELVAGAPRGA